MSRITIIRLLCAGAVLVGINGCGLKGALYLPEHNSGTVVTRPGTTQSNGAGQPATPHADATPSPASTPGATTPAPTTPGATRKDSKKDDSDPSR